MARNNNKLAMLEAGGRIIHRKGFNHTGINEIIQAANAPKGTFYYYFKNKEDYGLSLLDHYSGFFVGKLKELESRENYSPLDRLEKFFNEFQAFFEQCDCGLGCPIGNLSLEMADLNEKFRRKLEDIFLIMSSAIAKNLDEAITAGELTQVDDTRETADFIINSWEGAILRMKAQKSVEPLRLLNKMIFGSLLK